MTDPRTFQLIAATLHFVAALLWATIAWDLWAFRRKRRPRNPIFGVLVWLGTLVAVHYLLWSVFLLVPSHLQGETNALRALLLAFMDGGVVVFLALARHFVLGWPIRATPPGPLWLAVNYGAALLAAFVFALVDLEVVRLPANVFLLITAYFGVVGVVTIRDVHRLARAGAWRAGSFGEHVSADLLVGAGGFLCVLTAQLIPLINGTTPLLMMKTGMGSAPATWFFVLNAAGGLACAIPFAVRDLADVLRGFVTTTVMIAATASFYFGVHAWSGRLADAELRRLVDLAGVIGLVLVLMRMQPWLGAAIDRLVFHRSRRRWAEVQAVFHTLPPEAGVADGCRRALAALARAMQFRGAAFIAHDGEAVVHGSFALEPLMRGWPGWVGALPPHPIGQARFRDLPLPLIEALMEADVTAIAPIVSPRRGWGHVLITTGLLGASFSDEDDQAVEAAADQLARVLDGAELLARAVLVERSLAHAEKLAAIGELAARIAHEIRNPVTAARSLAQQLAREPDAPFAMEHGLILTELERVERQVSDLLRFARREEFRFESVDLAELARATVDSLRPRLEAAGVDVALDLAHQVTARADREKMRQVLINLIENALDALGETAGARRLLVAVGSVNGSAKLQVTDSGPGVPADTLAHLFEPFFSLKEKGTGLGLAIAKRTIDAHGGRIEAASTTGAGMTLHIELPLSGSMSR